MRIKIVIGFHLTIQMIIYRESNPLSDNEYCPPQSPGRNTLLDITVGGYPTNGCNRYDPRQYRID
jgi:hypothetical protein